MKMGSGKALNSYNNRVGIWKRRRQTAFQARLSELNRTCQLESGSSAAVVFYGSDAVNKTLATRQS